MDSNLREAGSSDGSRKATLRQCGSLRRSRILDAGISAGAKHAVVRCIARGGLVRARNGATREESFDPATFTLHRTKAAPLSEPDRQRVTFQSVRRSVTAEAIFRH